ncbi:MAG: hypothetical protein OEW75_02080 [Cyclobacteriaceae bacterium]|nr:hypothetical protein [Cyclobacteriaceae bacterium]
MVKKIIFFITILLIPLFLLLGCASSTDPLADFEKETWQKDIQGCNGDRILLLPKIKKLKENIKGKYSSYIVENLGNPDEKEIVKRSQLYFRYFLYNPIVCDSTKTTEGEKFVQIRFNATGLLDELIIVE